MTIHGYAQIIRRRWRILVVLPVLCVVAAAYWSATTTPLYRSTASVYFSLSYGNSAVDLSQGSSYTQAQMESYSMLAKSPRVLNEVVKRLPFETSTAHLASEISTTVAAGTVIIRISVADASAEHAAVIANQVANELGVTAKKLSPKNAAGDPTVDVSTVGQATVSGEPAVPATKRNIVAGLLGGLILALVTAVLRDKLDDKVRTKADLTEVVDMPVLGEVTIPTRSRGSRLPVRDVPLSARAESFRKVRTNVKFLQAGDGPHSLVVTSTQASEGKTSTALNLALACAEIGDRVLLIDADMRRPAIAESLNLEGVAGLSTVLSGLAEFEAVVQPVGDDGRLSVLPAGAVPPNPGQLLSSIAMTSLVRRLSAEYDIVILDCPPLHPVTDAAVIARLTAGAILIAAAGHVSRSDLAGSAVALEQVGAELLGVVLTRKRFGAGPDRTYGSAPRGTKRTGTSHVSVRSRRDRRAHHIVADAPDGERGRRPQNKVEEGMSS